MNICERKILNTLVDSYERSSLMRGTNKVAVHISFPFTRRTIPEYFDETSSKYEEIHEALRVMEDLGYVTVSWKNARTGHIVQKVTLNTDQIESVYRYLNRIPKSEHERHQLEVLERLEQSFAEMPADNFPNTAVKFILWLRERIEAGDSVKEFIDLADYRYTERLVSCAVYVETNKKACYYREFSVRNFADSKVFEQLAGAVRKIFVRFGGASPDTGERELFAEYGIYETPNYVYIKGEGSLEAGGQRIALSLFRQGIGVSGEDLETVAISGTDRLKRVITVENLTTFFQWREENSLIIYLGGYHNQTRRRLLGMIYEKIPGAEYLHFGDIDAGGFAIYEDLCRKTGIGFRTYHMGIRELEKYRNYCKPLSENDRKRLQKMLDRNDAECEYRDVLEYMLENGIKLEQEILFEEV